MFLAFRVSLNSLERLSATDVKCVWSQKKTVFGQKYKPLPILETECFKSKLVEPKSLTADYEQNLNLLQKFAPPNSAFSLYM